MNESNDIDHEYTSSIVCPHCGYESEWEPDNSEVFEEECGDCGKEYRVSVHHSVDFSTEVFDRKAEEREASREKAIEKAATAVRYAACQKFPPGTRVRVLETAWSRSQRGRTGTVANRELHKGMPSVNVDMDEARDRAWPRLFGPDEVEALPC